MAAEAVPGGARQRSVGEHVVRASLVVGLAHLCLKIMGLVQAAIAGQYLETEVFAVVYVFAFESVLYSVYLIGEEAIGPSFLPVFMAEKDERGEEAAWRFASALLTIQLLVLLVAVGVILCFPDVVIRLLTDWTPETKPKLYPLARQSVMWLAPSLICLSLGSTTYMMLNGYKRFFLAAFGDAAWKIFTVIALVVGIGIFHWDYRALVFGVVVGSVAKLVTHLIGLRGERRFWRLCLDWRSPAMRSLWLLMLPLLAGIVLAKGRDVFNNLTVISSLDAGVGLLQANSLGRKLFQGLSWLIPYTVSIAMFPFFCELVDKRDWQRLGALMSQACRMLLAIFVPAAVVLAILAPAMSSVLFQRGHVDWYMAQLIGISAACYLLVMPAFALEYILMQGYFANRKMISVTVIGVVFSLLSVVVSYVAIRVCGADGLWALAAVALGYTVARTLKTVTLVAVLRRSVPLLPPRETLAFLGRLAALSVLCGEAAWLSLHLATRLPLPGSGKVELLAVLAIVGLVTLAAFAAGAKVLHVQEPWTMAAWGWQKVRRKLRR